MTWYDRSKLSVGNRLVVEAGSPITNFDLGEIEKMLWYLGFENKTRTEGSHTTYTNPYNHKTVQVVVNDAKNAPNAIYTSLTKMYPRSAIEYYVANRKRLLKEKKRFLAANPGAYYEPQLGTNKKAPQAATPAPEASEEKRERPSAAFPESYWKIAVDKVREMISHFPGEDDQILNIVSEEYGLPIEGLQGRMGM